LAMVLAGHTQGTESGLSWHDTRGNLQSVSQYKGRIVLLNFWATWCVPCQHEMPMLADVQRKYADKGLVVLGGSVDDSTTQARIDPFAGKAKIPFPLLVGATTEQMQKLQLEKRFLRLLSSTPMESWLHVCLGSWISMTCSIDLSGSWANIVAKSRRLLSTDCGRNLSRNPFRQFSRIKSTGRAARLLCSRFRKRPSQH